MGPNIMFAISLFLLVSWVPATHSKELPPAIQKAFKDLQTYFATVQKQPKGIPFSPLVSQPNPSQRIAIVGAGLAGLHMAYLLKKKGFDNVVVLEKESRIGGKVMSLKHNGVIHEMGACYTSPDYTTNVYALAKELGVDDFAPLPSSTIWLDGIPRPLPYKSYVISQVKHLTDAETDIQAVQNLINATYRYSILHHQMFGMYEGELMYKPSKDVLARLNQTLLSFLTEHELLALVPFLTAAHTMQGYGHIDTVSAIYGMLWNTPHFLYAVLGRSLGVGQGGFKMFRNGFMQLTDKLAALADDVRLNVNIDKIKRDHSGITIKYRVNNEYNTEVFDFLIWAADTREALKVLDKTTPLEGKFSRLKNTWFSTTLFDSEEQCKSYTPLDSWLSNLVQKREHSVWVRRDAKYVMNGENCPTTLGVKTKISTVAYQMGSYSPAGTNQVNDIFNQHFIGGLGGEDVNILKAKTWNYFPRFSVHDLADGILWEIMEEQGVGNTWFIGSSVIFESTKSVIEYNHLMMRRMELSRQKFEL